MEGCPDRGHEPERKEEEDAAEWVRRKLGFDPDPKRALVLTSASKRGMLNCAWQWGKSTITAANPACEQRCGDRVSPASSPPWPA